MECQTNAERGTLSLRKQRIAGRAQTARGACRRVRHRMGNDKEGLISTEDVENKSGLRIDAYQCK